MKIKRLK